MARNCVLRKTLALWNLIGVLLVYCVCILGGYIFNSICSSLCGSWRRQINDIFSEEWQNRRVRYGGEKQPGWLRNATMRFTFICVTTRDHRLIFTIPEQHSPVDSACVFHPLEHHSAIGKSFLPTSLSHFGSGAHGGTRLISGIRSI